MRVTLPDLASHTDYFLEARSKRDGLTSRWSPVFHFVTDKDTIPPGLVTDLAVNVDGKGFRLTWAAPAQDAAGNPLADLSHFEVTVSDGVAFGAYKVIGLSFDFGYDMNVSLFGSPKGALEFSVIAVDKTDNRGAPVTVEGSNEPPQNVTGLVGTAGTDEIRLSWNAVADEDFRDYAVYVNDTNDFASATEAQITVLPFIDYQTSLYNEDHFFWIKAIDSFGTRSLEPSNVTGPHRPNTVFTLDTEAPPVPTALTLTPGPNSITVSWTEPGDTDAKGYRVRYRESASDPWNYLEAGLPDGTGTPYPIITGLIAGATYTVEVQPYDDNFNFGVWVSGTAVPTIDPSSPGVVTGVIGTVNSDTISLAWDRVTTAAEYQAVLYSNSARTAIAHTRNVTGTVAIFGGLPLDTTYWPSIRARSASGVYSGWTTVGSASGITTGVELTFDQIGGTLDGDVLVEDSVRAETLKADSTITHDLKVGARLTMGTGLNGEIVSGNYYDSNGVATGNGYRLTSSNLDLRSGTINAGMITVGSFKSSKNIGDAGVTSEGQTGQPVWFINTQGAAEFSDVRVRGRILVGDTANSAAVNATISVRSANYSAGTAGWAIAGDGNVEFNSGVFRGSLAAGGTAASPALFVDKTSGNLLVGNVSTTNGTANFKVTGSTGAVSIGGSGSLTIGANFGVTSAGYLTSKSGLIGGWNIYDGYLASGNMTISGTGGLSFGGNFSVSSTGYLTSSYGTIGGWTINASSLSGSGYIYGGTIEGATVTGGTIQTATSGARIVFGVSNPNTIYFYDSGGGLGTLQASGSGVYFSGGGGSANSFHISNDTGGTWSSSRDIYMNSTYLRLRNASTGSFTDLTVPYSGGLALNGYALSFSHDHPYASSGHDHGTGGSTIITTANRANYTFPSTSHTHGQYALEGSKSTGQPVWTGGGDNAYDTGGGRGTSISGHVHTSTSHYHTVTI